MDIEIEKNSNLPQTVRRINMINAARFIVVLAMISFLTMAVMIVFSGPTRSTEGFYIQSVEDGSPADIAGVTGILTHINGKRVSSFSEWSDVIYDNLGESMAWTLLIRDGTVRIVEVTPIERPEAGQSATGIIFAQQLTRPVGRISRIIEIAPIAYIGMGMLTLIELAAWRRRRADVISEILVSNESNLQVPI